MPGARARPGPPPQTGGVYLTLLLQCLAYEGHGREEAPLNDWPLYDPQLMLAIAGCLIAITFVLLIALLKTRVRRAEFARLQRDIEEMSEHVKELQAAEQLRFLKEIKASKKDDDGPSIIPSFLKTA
jgi:hypothetical protein